MCWKWHESEAGKLVLKKEVGCVTDLIESLIDVFEPGVKKKFITYSCETDIQHKYVIGDETSPGDFYQYHRKFCEVYAGRRKDLRKCERRTI